jgi:signal transduction histidine kinase
MAREEANDLQLDTISTRVLESSRGFERLLADLVSSLANASADTLDGRIRDGLGRLASRAGVERGSFARFSEDGDTLTVTHSSGTPAMPTPFRVDLRWYLAQLRHGRCPTLSRLPGDLPVEATAEREVFRAMGIRSHVAVPLFRDDRVWGVIALATPLQARLWMPEDIQRLRVAGEIMMASMQRHAAEATTRRLRDELTHVARVASLGDLTVALTHELNQPLTAIRANAQATQRLLAGGARTDELDDVLADIVADATRAADLIQRLASLFRRGELERLPVDVNQVVRDFHVIARAEAGRHGAHLVLRLAPDLEQVAGDPVQIQQVLLNLIRNAAEAMANIEPDAREVEVSTSATAPGQITVSVGDSGPPIDEAAFNRLFRPFDTTKPDGLGMGLSISRSIVEAHGGRLWAERRATGGLVMHVTLPTEMHLATADNHLQLSASRNVAPGLDRSTRSKET